MTKLCLILCDPVNCSTPGFPVLHYLQGFAQIHVEQEGRGYLSRWCYLTISSSATPFSFCLQSFPSSGSLPKSQLFTSSSLGVLIKPYSPGQRQEATFSKDITILFLHTPPIGTKSHPVTLPIYCCSLYKRKCRSVTQLSPRLQPWVIASIISHLWEL